MNSSKDNIKNPIPRPNNDSAQEIHHSIDIDGQTPPPPSGFSQQEAVENSQPEVDRQPLTKPNQTFKSYSILNSAVQTETINIVKMLLDSNANVTVRQRNRGEIPRQYAVASSSDFKNASPLHCNYGYSEHVELFICFGENINNCADFESLSKALISLHVAEDSSSLDIVEISIEDGCVVHTATNEGLTPLVIACKHWFGEIAEILLENSTCTQLVINSMNNECCTLLHVAAEGGSVLIVQSLKRGLNTADKRSHAELVKISLESGADTNSHVATGSILPKAVRLGNIGIIYNIFQYRPDIYLNCNNVEKLVSYRFRHDYRDTNIQSIITNTIKEGYYNIVRHFLQSGVVEQNYIFSALHNRQDDTAKLLIEHGTNVKEIYKCNAPLFHTVRQHLNWKLIEIFLDAPPENVIELKLPKYAVAGSALRNSLIDAIERLLSYGVDVNMQYSDLGETALHYAVSLHYQFHSLAEEIQLAIVNLLLSKGASVNAQTRNGSTPLHLAVFYNSGKVVNALLKYNANVNTPDQEGITPFHLSIERSNDIFEMLLTTSTNFNAPTNNGVTPLHLATYHNNEKVVTTLLKFNADPNIADDNGLTPLYIAVFKNSLVITGMLVNANADMCVQIYQPGAIFEFPYNLPKPKHVNWPGSISIFARQPRPIALVSPAYRFESDSKDTIPLRPASETSTTFSVLDIASMTNNLEIVEFLLKHNARVDFQSHSNDSVLHSSVINDDYIDVVALLLRNSADVNAKNNSGETPLLIALGNRCNELAKLLVSCGADVNASNNDNESALHRAAARCNSEVVKLLLKNGATIEVKKNCGRTALHCVSPNKDGEKTVEMLIQHGIDVNARCFNGSTALHYVLLKENPEKIVKMLIKYGVDVNATNCYGETALHSASSNWHGDEKIVEMLIKCGVDVNAITSNTGETALHCASKSRRGEKIAEMLIKYGVGVNAGNFWGTTALHNASDNGHDGEKMVEMLIKCGVDVNITSSWGETALHHALWYKHGEKIAAMLIKCGVDVNATSFLGHTALHDASLRGYCEKSMEMLIKCGVDVNATSSEGKTALHYASINHGEKIVEMLIKSGADVNATSPEGETALHCALTNRDAEKIVGMLIKCGVDVNATLHSGKTALHCASKIRHGEKIVEMLIKCGLDVHATTSTGKTALHYASEVEDAEKIVKMLIKSGVNVNATTSSGTTALHHASSNRHGEKVLEMLIQYGVDINATSSSGETALHFASRGENTDEIVEKLIKCGVDINVKSALGHTALHCALKNLTSMYLHSAVKKVEILLKYGIDVNAGCSLGRTALHYVSSSMHEYAMRRSLTYRHTKKIVEMLVKYGVDVNARCFSGKTALHYASSNGGDKIVEMLIKSGADVNARCSSGKTALCYALWSSNTVRVLLKNNADINAKDSLIERTPLHLAAEDRDKTLVEMLIKFNADVNLQDREGNTPLHLVKDHNIVKVLLKNGADVNLKNLSNLTPYHQCSPQIKALILKYEMKGDHHRKQMYLLRHSELECMFVKHFIKMSMAGLSLDEMNLSLLESFCANEDFLIECKKELARMKINIGVSNISFHDVMIRGCSSKFALKGEVVQALKSSDLKSEFPLYSVFFNWKLINRITLLSDSMKTFRENIFDLPSVCIEKILHLLDDKDLEIFVQFDEVQELHICE